MAAASLVNAPHLRNPMARERMLAQTFVELADSLVDDFDVVDFLHTLANRCAELFEVAEAGVMLITPRKTLQEVASSSERARLLEIFEIEHVQGPCLDSFNLGAVVSVDDLAQETERWPLFVPQAQSVGFRSVHSLPLRFRSQVIGALNIFREDIGALDAEDLNGAQAMADIATISILQERAVKEARVLAEQLQGALNSRVVIEQAKGVLAERAQLNLDDAFKLLRAYARNSNRRLHDVATAVISGELTVEQLTHPGG